MRKRLITPCYALFFLLRANIGGIEYNGNFNHGNYDNGGQKSSKWFNIIWNSTFKLEMGSALVIKGQVGLGTGGNRGQHYHHQPDLVHLGHFSHNSQIGYFLVHTFKLSANPGTMLSLLWNRFSQSQRQCYAWSITTLKSFLWKNMFFGFAFFGLF